MTTPKQQTRRIEDQHTLLLVDDVQENLDLLYNTLKPLGHRLLVANSGERALKAVEKSKPDLILLDIMMPGVNGFEVCERLKASEATGHIPVIFLSVLDEPRSIVRGFELGGVDYITKPFSASEVVARVNTHLKIHRLETQLQIQNRQLKTDKSRILNAMNEGIYGLDNDGRITFANPAALRLARFRASDIEKEAFFELHFPQSDDAESARVTALIKRAMKSGNAAHLRGVEMSRKRGDPFLGELKISPALEGDDIEGCVVVFRDVTAEIEQERALQQAEGELAEQREQLAHASRLTLVGEMAAGFAHEVNQPLTAIGNYARAALRMTGQPATDEAQLHKVLEKMEAQAQRASEVIKRIRNFVRRPELDKASVSPRKLLEDTLLFAEVDAKTNGVDIELLCPDELPRVNADLIQLQQVLLNLIRNALEATKFAGSPEPVLVEIHWDPEQSPPPEQVTVSVSDRGCGLSEDAEDYLFHPFYTTKQDGMGIGLSICQTIIQQFGGTIGFERREGGGTRFYFTLPIARAL